MLAGSGQIESGMRANPKGRILIVEDTVSMAELYRAYLAKAGFECDIAGTGAADPLKSGTELFKNDEVRVWTQDGQVVIASITAKLHLISPAVTEGLLKAVEIAEADYKGLVIWSPDDVFSAGANLESLMPVFMKMGSKGSQFQDRKLSPLSAK